MDSSVQEARQSIREEVRRLCQDFPDTYWQDVDKHEKYPQEFVDALTRATLEAINRRLQVLVVAAELEVVTGKVLVDIELPDTPIVFLVAEKWETAVGDRRGDCVVNRLSDGGTQTAIRLTLPVFAGLAIDNP